MAMSLKSESSFHVEEGATRAHDGFDDDGRIKRKGTILTASAHIITAVIGSGVLSLAWAMAQLGWVVGVLTLVAFSIITWYCSTLLADCYRSPDPVTGKRNYSYMDAVRANLGGVQVQICGITQYAIQIGITVGYTITTAISMAAVKRSNCFHKNGHDKECPAPLNVYMIAFAVMEIVLSQIPNFDNIWWLSILAAVMSFAYSLIGLGLSILKIGGDQGFKTRTTLTGVPVGLNVSEADKVWRMLQSLGNIAAAFSFSLVLIEIQDTLKSSPPENYVMKKASLVGVLTTTVFYLLCGICGYAAFGNDAPGNLLTGFGVYDPFWLISIGNICIAVHLIGAYQVFCQPIFQFVEDRVRKYRPNSSFLSTEHRIPIPLLGNYHFNYFRLTGRTVYVVLTTLVAMIFPFFNSFLGLIGALGFWPLTVYFPVTMYIAKARIQRFSAKWTALNLMSLVCLVMALAAFCGSVQGLIHDLGTYRPFKNF